MKKSPLKILVLAFNHYDNVLSYTKALAEHTDLNVTVALIVHGNRFFTGAFETELASLPLGLIEENIVTKIFPAELHGYYPANLKIWLLRLLPRTVTLSNLWCSLTILRGLAIKVRKSFDVFHINGVGPYALYMSHLLKHEKKVLTIHDYVSHTGEGGYLTKWTNQRLVANCGHFIQHYDYLAHSMKEYYKLSSQQVHTLRSGTFDMFREFAGTMLPYRNYILFFGRISPYKGLRYLVKAFSKYCSNNDSLDLVIAGAGDVTDILAGISANSRIHLINRMISIYELTSLIRGCTFVACPYTDATHSAVVMVSYTFGKAVMAHDVGGLAEVVLHNKTGFLLADLHEETIAKGIKSMESLVLSEDVESEIKLLTEKGTLSWPKIANDYKQVYSQVMMGK